MVKKRLIVCVSALVLLVAVVAGIVLLGRSSGAEQEQALARCQALFEQKEYDACRAELNNLLEQTPDWHEARRLLALVELELNDLESAVTHMLYLAQSQQDIDQISAKLIAKLGSAPSQQEVCRALVAEFVRENTGHVDLLRILVEIDLLVHNLPEALIGIFALIEEGQDVDPQMVRFKQLFKLPRNQEQRELCFAILKDKKASSGEFVSILWLELAVTCQDVHQVGKSVDHLIAVSIQGHQELISQAMRLLLEAREFPLLLSFAVRLNPEQFEDASWYWRLYGEIVDMSLVELDALLLELPGNFLVLEAKFLIYWEQHQYSKALAMILQLEDEDTLPTPLISYKASLLENVRPSPLTERHFRNLSDTDIFGLYRKWLLTHPQSATAALQHVKDKPEWQRQLRALAQVKDPPPAPNPVWNIDVGRDRYSVFISPTGKQALITYDHYDGDTVEPTYTEWRLLDLETGSLGPWLGKKEAISLSDEIHWSPDGTRIWFRPFSYGDTDYLYYPDTDLLDPITPPGGPIYGWYDHNSILQIVYDHSSQPIIEHIESWNVDNGTSTRLYTNSRHRPTMLGGRLALIADGVMMLDGTTYSLPENYRVFDVIPGGLGYMAYGSYNEPLLFIYSDRMEFLPSPPAVLRGSPGNQFLYGIYIDMLFRIAPETLEMTSIGIKAGTNTIVWGNMVLTWGDWVLTGKNPTLHIYNLGH